ncbi:glycosyltransferase family A protein [uncultured Acetatifactor sp.]|uniref:glycosyltransferase family 2 protein n=1 Tax=uncultured Acetatifactor sp. TaxID=1671927 RepID=UPI00260D6640|nr:glycosyltransferase family A protein [uncultured Acetatifactor sp.]
MKTSIIMPVYNREAYVQEAIESILHQTMSDLELIVIDDCSKDHTAEIVKSIHDERIRFVQNSSKSTLPLLRNEGVSLAKGDYIGYMDSDDIAACDRLEKEVSFLESHPDYGAVSCHYQVFGDRSFEVRLPLEHEDICGQLLVRCVMNYGGSLFRHSLFDGGLWHRSEYFVCEDYRFWVELIGRTKMANIDEVLVRVRFGNHQSTRESCQDTEKLSIRKALIDEIHKVAFRNMGLVFSEADILSYNRYLQLFQPEAAYSAGEVDDIIRLYGIVEEQLRNMHPEYLSGFTTGMSERFPFIDFRKN